MKMLLFVFLMIILPSMSYAYYEEMISVDEFSDLFTKNGVLVSSLKYYKKSQDGLNVYFSGSGKISGVLVYNYYLADIAVPGKWRLIFYPDKQGKINITDEYGFDSIILLKDMSNPAENFGMNIVSDSVNITDDEFKKVFGENYSKVDRNIVGGMAVHIELDIQNLQFINEIGYVSQFDTSYIKSTGKMKKWYLDASKTANTICLKTNDNYSNFRKFPSGEILFKIYKDKLNDDNNHSNKKGYLIEIQTKDIDSVWILLSYLEAGQLTWENGILGYIHNSQIDYCENIRYE